MSIAVQKRSIGTSFFILLIFILLFLLLGQFIHFDHESYVRVLRGIPWAISGVLFVLLYVIVTFFIWLGPKDVFRLAAAYVYGAWGSTLLVWIAEMGNLLILFSLSRKLGRGFVESKLKGQWNRWDQTLQQTSGWWIFVLRFFPIVPFRFLDLGMGLTQVPLKKYFFISLIASPARIFFVQYFLALGLDAVRDPNRLAEILMQDPAVFIVVSSYTVLAWVMMFFLGKSLRSVRTS